LEEDADGLRETGQARRGLGEKKDWGLGETAREEAPYLFSLLLSQPHRYTCPNKWS
jgi:hypothetical protein